MKPPPPSSKDNRRPALVRWLGNIGLILALFAAVHWWQTRPLASGAAPPLVADLVGGGRVDLAALQGRPVLVHFWAEWCPVCRAGQGAIEAVSKDFTVVTVAMQSGDAQAVREHLQGQGLSFDTVADPAGLVAGDWGVRAVPANFIIDASGTIRFTEVGYTTEAGLRARLWAAGSMGDG